MQLNIVKLKATADAAKAIAPSEWSHRIDNALEEILSNPYMHYDGHGLLVLSDSGKTYYANGTCQCKAYHFKQVCWHRIGAKLIKRYMEAE